MFSNGLYGVPEDLAEGARWYRLAADQGHEWAQFMTGVNYYVGLGVQRDFVEAARWFRRAANQGHIDAQYEIGTLHLRGEGVTQDYVQAHMWLNLATAQSPPEMRDKYAIQKDRTEDRMTAEQIADAQHRAREWTPTPEP